jgi:hypothetical protein
MCLQIITQNAVIFFAGTLKIRNYIHFYIKYFISTRIYAIDKTQQQFLKAIFYFVNAQIRTQQVVNAMCISIFQVEE